MKFTDIFIHRPVLATVINLLILFIGLRSLGLLEVRQYPEMKKGINVFILINVQAKKEIKLMDKLFELEEVKEVHSVHGDVDLLFKVLLARNLISSDAEVISQFVHEQVRQLPGVISTKTLIPGLSKIKVPDVCQKFVNNKADQK